MCFETQNRDPLSTCDSLPYTCLMPLAYEVTSPMRVSYCGLGVAKYIPLAQISGFQHVAISSSGWDVALWPRQPRLDSCYGQRFWCLLCCSRQRMSCMGIPAHACRRREDASGDIRIAAAGHVPSARALRPGRQHHRFAESRDTNAYRAMARHSVLSCSRVPHVSLRRAMQHRTM